MLHFCGILKFLPLLHLHVGVSDYTWQPITDCLLYVKEILGHMFMNSEARVALITFKKQQQQQKNEMPRVMCKAVVGWQKEGCSANRCRPTVKH